jgi:hypothetical protein
MTPNAPNNARRDFQVEGKMLPMTELDFASVIPHELLAGVPVGGLVRDEELLELVEWDCTPPKVQPPSGSQRSSNPAKFPQRMGGNWVPS